MKKSIEFDCYDSFEEASAAARERFSKHFTEEEMDDIKENMWLFDDCVLVLYSLSVGKRFGNRFSLVKLPEEDEEEEEEEC